MFINATILNPNIKNSVYKLHNDLHLTLNDIACLFT